MFLETICIQDGVAQHLDFHQLRIDETFEQFYPEWEAFDVVGLVNSLEIPSSGTHRLRIVYEEDPIQIEVIPYLEKEIKTFQLVESGEIDYGFKWSDREFFKQILELHPGVDEVIFTKDGKIQDCSIANLAFLKDGIWYTPEDPLHWGTTRARLIVEEKIEEADILVEELGQYERICLINVFRPLDLKRSLLVADVIS
jgi:4-amino-4-deoxychorismate lyase